LWQIPAAIAGAAVSIGAITYAIKTTPRIDRGEGLVEATKLIEDGKYEDALGVLNTKVLPLLPANSLTKDQQRKFYLLRARAIYQGQKELGISRPENDKHVLEEYKEAESRSAELTPRDLEYRCNTLINLGEFDKALEAMEQLPTEAAEAKRGIHKRLIDAALAGGPPRAEVALDLITRFTQEPELDDEERLWGLGRQAKMLLAGGMPEDAVTRILRAMPRLENSKGPLVGEVLVTLAEAYLALDQVARAGQQLERAQQLLGESHVLAPRVARLIGFVSQSTGGESLPHAKEVYKHVLADWPNSDETPRALLGLGEVEALLANTQTPSLANDSIRHYSELVSRIKGEPIASEPTEPDAGKDHAQADGPEKGADEHKPASDGSKQRAEKETADHGSQAKVESKAGTAPEHGEEAKSEEKHPGASEKKEEGNGFIPKKADDPKLLEDAKLSLEARFAEQFDRKDYQTALRYAELAKKLAGVDDASPALLLGLASTHRELASQLLGKGNGATALTLAKADPATQREAREHLLRAGEYYRLHAAKSVQTDTRGYGDSLWAAADMFDRAGDLGSSSAAFEQFAADFPSDTRRPDAVFRLAEARRAAGDPEAAAKLYRELIANRSASRENGPVADASYVPLAKTLLMDNKAENDPEAEELLQRVVRGDIGGTATPMFREALRTLGEYYYDSGQHERAIERLSEYLGRSERAVTDQTPAANSTASIPSVADLVPQPTDDGETLGLYYKLADAYRKSADKIDEGFAAAMPDARRQELGVARRERLEHAMALFDAVQRAYDRAGKRTGSAATRRTAIDELRLRNATFFKADCAFDLGDFDTAVRLYDAAKERYSRDPASLVAMVQIVASLLHQGKTAEAATANTRARRFYESLPESAWDDPSLPMTRKQWEQWLDAQGKLATAGEEGQR
jgi:TolA-binding protein